MNDIPDIPSINDEELRLAVSSLAGAAYLMRGVFVQLARGKPVEEIMAERGEYLELAERVIDGWCNYFDIDDGHEFNGSAM